MHWHPCSIQTTSSDTWDGDIDWWLFSALLGDSSHSMTKLQLVLPTTFLLLVYVDIHIKQCHLRTWQNGMRSLLNLHPMETTSPLTLMHCTTYRVRNDSHNLADALISISHSWLSIQWSRSILMNSIAVSCCARLTSISFNRELLHDMLTCCSDVACPSAAFFWKVSHVCNIVTQHFSIFFVIKDVFQSTTSPYFVLHPLDIRILQKEQSSTMSAVRLWGNMMLKRLLCRRLCVRRAD